jgi:hypothetical protein
MSIDPTCILPIIHIGGRGDPALDREHPGLSEAVTLHARTRDAASLDALRACAHEGRRPVEFHLTPLSPSAMFNLSAVQDDRQRALSAFLAACFTVVDRDGVRHEAKLSPGAHGGRREAGTYPTAPWPWFERWARDCGMDAIVEAGAVALRRAEVGPDDEGFYWPLGGVPRLMR